MTNDPWLEAARYYSSLSDAERHRYWADLVPAQQQALTDALGRLQQPEPLTPRAAGPKKHAGPLALFFSAAAGFVLGAILTALLELVVVVAGIRSMLPALPEWDATSFGKPVDPMPSHCETVGPGSSQEDQVDCQNWVDRQIARHPEILGEVSE